ncbi:MAG: hypothetical protein A2Y06_02290 [Omnitrophica WOR_2 bacterium GWA2_37_7]|nr:MAG: hypothetical protein A2Y06_02290 [Omnitrophica WOR_2 bacterium GWA2_37_7]
MGKLTTENRQFPRINATFPIHITPEFLGKTVDLSETGLRLVFDKPLLLSKAQAKIELSPEESIDTEFKVIWNKHLVSDGKFTYGACFVRLKEKDINILGRVLERSKLLDERFDKVTAEFRDYLTSIKNKFNHFDAKGPSEKDEVSFIESEKTGIFKRLDFYFHTTWEIVKGFDKDAYKLHKRYYQKNLDPLLIDPIEINRYIRQKPLGYSGDFVTMNYIYDYHKGNYLGDSPYEKLINNYTCNIPFSGSNITRKEFFKKKILEKINQKENVRILSVGSGPSRELLELLKEGKIRKKVMFHCLDSDRRASEYIRSEIKSEYSNKVSIVGINFLNYNMVDILKNRKLTNELMNQDLIYAGGIFDYLKDHVASRLIKQLYLLLNKDSFLIICNASSEFCSHRAYYEMLGEWVMLYRTKEEILALTRSLSNVAEIKFEHVSEGNNYFYLSILKS